MNPDQAEEWSIRYQQGQTGWDLGAPAPNLQRLVQEWVPAGSRIIVPGCGRGHDAIAFARKGYRVTAVDFAPEAVEAASRAASEAGVEVEFMTGDIFALPEKFVGGFDAWIELTCFCAISPRRREDYVRQAARLLKPGRLVAGVFFIGLPAGGPPFDSTADEIARLFGDVFETLKLEPSTDSVPARLGKEWEGVFRLR